MENAMKSYAVSLPFPFSLIILWNDYHTSTMPTKIPFVRIQRPPINMRELPEGTDYIATLMSRYPYISKKEKAILKPFIAF